MSWKELSEVLSLTLGSSRTLLPGYIDSKLNFEAHCKKIIKTFSFKLYLYRRVHNCLNDLAAKGRRQN